MELPEPLAEYIGQRSVTEQVGVDVIFKLGNFSVFHDFPTVTKISVERKGK